MSAGKLFTKIDTVIMRVRNLEQARQWYEEKLGFKPGYVDERERLVVFEIGGPTSLTIWEWKPGEAVPDTKQPSSFPIFYPEDVMEAHRTLAERGVDVGPIEGEPGSTQWFFFRDPDGNRMEVCHY